MIRATSPAVTVWGFKWALRCAVAIGVTVAAVAYAATGMLTQLSGTAACVSDTGSSGACADGAALVGPTAVAVSRDGRHAYVASFFSSAVVALARNKSTGALTQLAGTSGCVSEDGTGGACVDGAGLFDALDVAVSRDGKHVYVASEGSGAVAIFARNKATGALTQLAGTAGCVSQDGSGGACAVGTALDGAAALAVSEDGKHLYVASDSADAVAVFARDRSTGALTQLAGPAGCVSEDGSGGTCTDGTALVGANGVAVSRDGKHVYVTSAVSGAVAVFARDKSTGTLAQLGGIAGCISEDGSGGACVDGRELADADDVAVTNDGKHVYVTSTDAVAAFARDRTTGALTQLSGIAGCVSEDGSGGLCADGSVMTIATKVAPSRDGKSVYVASGSGLAIFARDRATGALTQLAGSPGCVTEDGDAGACTDGTAVEGLFGVTTSKDGRHVYTAAIASDAVAAFARAKQ